MLFRKEHKQTDKKRERQEKDLYPVLYVTDSLKHYHTDLVQKEVASLWELSLVGSSFNSVLGEAEQFQQKLEDLGANFFSVHEVSEQFVTVRDDISHSVEQAQDEVETLKNSSLEVESHFSEMGTTFAELRDSVEQIKQRMSRIVSIADQTNILAINASIEASRAGEAGKGFAVVANEIRTLAGETQKLTKDMNDFLENIKKASQKSIDSSNNTISSLGSMTEKIKNVWELTDESQQHVTKVNESISSIAAVSQEISSSMSEMEDQIRHSTVFMDNVSHALKKAVEPVVGIEKTLDTTLKEMGGMAEDAFYHLENREFAQYMSRAITSHRTWLSNLKKMVDAQNVTPLQLDSSKCGFGHFYYSITPDIPGIQEIWEALGEKHQKFHGFGSEAIQALFDEDYARAGQICREAEEYSRELISDMEKIQRIAED